MSNTIHTIEYNKLYQDFLTEHETVAKFLPPFNNTDRGITTKNILPVSNEQIEAKKILREQNSDLTSKKSNTYLKYLDDPNSVIIITGQQLGLFGSPLYTIYKAITVLKLVEELNLA